MQVVGAFVKSSASLCFCYVNLSLLNGMELAMDYG